MTETQETLNRKFAKVYGCLPKPNDHILVGCGPKSQVYRFVSWAPQNSILEPRRF